VNKFVPKLLTAVVGRAVEETRTLLAAFQKGDTSIDAELVVTPSVRLLLTFQRELAGAGFARTALIDYSNLLIAQCTQLIKDVVANHSQALLDKTSPPNSALLEKILQVRCICQ